MSIRNAMDAHWLRSELGEMADHAELAAPPWTMREVRIVLLAVASGESWRIALGRARYAESKR